MGVKMSTFTKQFTSADEYENWLRGVGERIHVLTITNSAPARNLSNRGAEQTVVVRYETQDRSLAPEKSKLGTLLQIVAIGTVFWALFIYAITKLL